jgi:hypothetical protein
MYLILICSCLISGLGEHPGKGALFWTLSGASRDSAIPELQLSAKPHFSGFFLSSCKLSAIQETLKTLHQNNILYFYNYNYIVQINKE